MIDGAHQPLQFNLGFDLKISLDYLASTLPGADPFLFFGNLSPSTEAVYDALQWTDSRPKPSYGVLQANWPDARIWYYAQFYQTTSPHWVGESFRVLEESLEEKIDAVVDTMSSPDEVKRAAAVVNYFPAGETISALKAVYYMNGAIFLGSNATLQEASVIGVTLTSGNIGDLIGVLQYGIMNDAAFSYNIADLIFVISGGRMSKTAPTTGFLTRLARAITTNTLLVIIDSPKQL